MMPFIIDTSDKRCEFLLKKIKAMGFIAFERDKENTYKNGILVFSPSKALEKADIAIEGGAVFGGRALSDAKAIMEERRICYFNMLEDEAFAVKNSIPTALGCIGELTNSSSICINEGKTLVIGFGRVAKTLVKYLCGIDAKAFVYTADKKEQALARVLSCGIETDLNNLWQYKFIINTVPAPLITQKAQGRIKQDAVVCDLASGSNVDIAALQKAGITAFRLPGLPGKTAPKSAAQYMWEYIEAALNSLDLEF